MRTLIVNGEKAQAAVDFRRGLDQRVYFPVAGQVMTVHFAGNCEVCGRSTYVVLEDPNADPRGMLGLHLNDNLEARDLGRRGADVVCCWNCHSNDGDAYRKAVAIGEARWR